MDLKTLVSGRLRPARSQRERFEALARPLDAEMYRVAYRLCGDADDAQDLVQDALVRAYTRFHQFQENTNFRAWVYSILTHLFINEYRRRQRLPRQIAWSELTPADEADASRAAGSRIGRPEAELLAHVTSQEIRAGIDALKEEFRTVIVLADMEQMSYEEIAQALSVPVGTVRSRLFRARRLLRSYLEALDRIADQELTGGDR